VGLRGAGKSTLGGALASRLGHALVDCDQELARAQGAESAGELLRRLGESEFREHEQQLLERLCADPEPHRVLATGGGVVERASNRELLRARTRCIWLRVPVELCARRVAAEPEQRPPLLGAPDAAAELAELAERRAPHYASVAALEWEPGPGAPDALAEALALELERRGWS